MKISDYDISITEDFFILSNFEFILKRMILVKFNMDEFLKVNNGLYASRITVASLYLTKYQKNIYSNFNMSISN